MVTDASIEDAVFCVGCGYDLRNLPADGPCPECGRAIADSLEGRRLAKADPAWLKRLAAGQSLVAVGLPLALSGFCLVPLLAIVFGIMGSSPAIAVSIVMAAVIAMVAGGTVLVSSGAILVTMPDPGERDAEPAYSPRNLARWGLAASVVLGFLAAIVTSLPVPVTVMMVARTVLPLLVVAGVTVGVTALLRCLTARAVRIPDHKLAWRTSSMAQRLRWLLALSLGGMLIPSIVSSLQWLIPALASVNLGPLRIVSAIIGTLAGLVVLFMLAQLTKIMRLHRNAYRAARNEAIAAR